MYMNIVSAAYHIGDLVKYYDMYADDIVSGAGDGIVLRIRTYSYGTAPEASPDVPDASIFACNAKLDKNNEFKSHNHSLNIYLVYRFKEQNIDWYENHNLELISKADNNPDSRS